MQVDPHAIAAAAGTTVFVDTPHGGELTLDRGREVVARVVSVGDAGSARISLAGQMIDVTTEARLSVGDDVRLSVARADATGVRLTIMSDPPTAPTNTAVSGTTGRVVSELARAGVPVTPQMTRAVGAVVDHIGGGDAAARAVATLAGRDLALSPAAASRVAAALEMAGTLGPALDALAARSAAVAGALPTGAPGADALRTLLAPNLANSEVAIARIAQASQLGITAPPSSTAVVVQNYVASQVAVTASLDDLAAQNSLLGMNQLHATRGQLVTPSTMPVGLAPAALQAALRGQAQAQAAVQDVDAPTQAPAVATATAAANNARSTATAAAATGSAAATATPTTTNAAHAIADLASLAGRFVASAGPTPGAATAANAQVARGMNAADIAQQAGPAGTAGAASASVAGHGASGDPAPIVTALRAFLQSPGTESDAARLLNTLNGATQAQVASAIRTLPESEALRLAGRLLDSMPGSAQLSAPALADVRAGVHAALDRLGDALRHRGGPHELATLRQVLEQVAASDPRPNVASDAARLLAAADGQQIISRTASGADPGYVYFQVPMPDGRGAEVMVRREPGRRQVTFDEFNIAFLLNTERLGTLMIQLDAHPAGIRADVKTDIAALEPFLRAQSEQLIEPLARESRRQVTITTGVFEETPPTTLLQPQLGALRPGANEFYA